MVQTRFIKGETKFFPMVDGIKHWEFNSSAEAELATTAWVVGKANGLSVNDFQHLFPAILRMLKETESPWSK